MRKHRCPIITGRRPPLTILARGWMETAGSEPGGGGDAERARQAGRDVVVAVRRGPVALVEQVLDVELRFRRLCHRENSPICHAVLTGRPQYGHCARRLSGGWRVRGELQCASSYWRAP